MLLRPKSDGFVLLHRKLMTSWPWDLPPSQFKVFTQLVLLATERDGEEIKIANRFIDARIGEVVDSIRGLAAHAGMSEATYKKALQRLVDKEFCEIGKRGSLTSVRVLNYEKYNVMVPPSPLQIVVSPKEVSSEASPRVPREGAIVQVESAKARAMARINRVGVKKASPGPLTLKLIEGGKRPDEAYKAAVLDQWSDCNELDWVGLVDILYQGVFGYRSAELLTITKRALNTFYPRIRKLMKVVQQWFPADHAWQLFCYFRWVFQNENKKSQWVAENTFESGTTRRPIALDKVFSIESLNAWRASVVVTEDVISGRRRRQTV